MTIKWLLALFLLGSFAYAVGQINTTAGTGQISTKAGTGVMTVSTITVVAAGTTGQCMGMLCGITYPN